MNSARGSWPECARFAVSPSAPQSMVSHGAPSRSMVAIGDPSSTAEALPTPWKRSDQAISAYPSRACPSNPAIPLRVVALAQAGEIFFHRSEEQTSELQSLMRLSYDVFCLKTKKKN